METQTKSKTPLIVGGIIAGILLVLGGGGYYFLTKDGETLPGIFYTRSISSKCVFNDKILCKHLNNFREQKYYSGTTKSTDKEGKSFESTFETEGEDKNHMVSVMDGKEFSNSIMIGNTSYDKDYTDNQWWKRTIKESDEKISVEPDYVSDFEESKDVDKTTYKKLGKEKVGKYNCFKYQIINPAITDNTYIWFDDQKYLLRKMVSEGTEGRMESLYSYDKVTISAPSPTKEWSDASAAASLGTIPGMNQAELDALQKEWEQYTNSFSSGPELTVPEDLENY